MTHSNDSHNTPPLPPSPKYVHVKRGMQWRGITRDERLPNDLQVGVEGS